MIRRWSSADRAARIVITVFCTAGLPTLAAQQAGLGRGTEGNAAQATSPGTSLPGPRLNPEWAPFEPRVAASTATGRSLLASGGDNHTFVFSTLALVLIGVIVVLLVVK